MTKSPVTFFICLLIFCLKLPAQKLKKADREIIGRLGNHVVYLADDKLEGRRAGSEGEKLAAAYIIKHFTDAGVKPKGNEGYLQSFPIYEGKQIGAATSLSIDNVELQQGVDYFPFPFSPDSKVEAMPAIALQESGMPWFVNIKEVVEANAANPHFDLVDFIKTKTAQVHEKGATALIVYNTAAKDDHLVFDAQDKSPKTAIPVVYVNKQAAKKHFDDELASFEILLTTQIKEQYRNGHNVVGFIDNGATGTVVLGAHYDHLGFGEDGGSLHRVAEKMIHNGADDNASGTAALIELGYLLGDKKFKDKNYLLIAFSGEELGLFGSRYFVENPTIDLASIHYMINMDMIGRLNEQDKAITIGGVGTSPSWSFLAADKKLPLIIKVDSSGSGPSDHTSFYRKNIPVLFFFTGLHSDYHKPSDDAEKVNTTGTYQVMQFISDIILRLNKQNIKPAFTRTAERQTTTTARFSVSLGIMPDYTYNGTGVRADGITEGRPAQKAGMEAGDIIIGLGGMPVNTMEDYMQALSKYKKGDQALLKYKKGEDVKEVQIVF